MSSSSRLICALLGLSVAACTLERGGAGLTNTIDGGVSGAAGLDSGGNSQGGSSAGNGSFGGNQSVGGVGGEGGTGAVAGVGGSAGVAGTAGTAGAGAAGSGGAVGNESVCTDGVDNDHDNLVDCADAVDCASYECVDTAPAGWQGYFRLRDYDTYDPATPKLPCAGGVQPTRYFTEPTPSSCSACACAPLNGATCGDTPIFCAMGNGSCNNPSDWTSNLADGNCHKPGSGDKGSCYLGQPAVTNAGSCQPQGGAQVDTNLFQGMVDICGDATPPGGGCGAQQSCVPRAAADYAGYICVSKAGEQDCPSGWNLRRVASANGSDARTCSACSCAPNTTCSPGTYKVYDLNDCGGDDSTVNSSSCKNLDGPMDFGFWSMRRSSLATPGGACTPSGGMPGGQVTLTGTQTFCCRP
ncbi:MAG: hypothetical protein H6718_23980 [Polyangiaceae bacterium]|nr:hypothetical protein [Polyangiaceae bacterium]